MDEDSFNKSSYSQRGNQQRNSNYRYSGNQNRQRYQNSRSGADSDRGHWRQCRVV